MKIPKISVRVLDSWPAREYPPVPLVFYHTSTLLPYGGGVLLR